MADTKQNTEAVEPSPFLLTLEQEQAKAQQALAQALLSAAGLVGMPDQVIAHLRQYAPAMASVLAGSAVLDLVIATRITATEEGSTNG